MSSSVSPAPPQEQPTCQPAAEPNPAQARNFGCVTARSSSSPRRARCSMYDHREARVRPQIQSGSRFHVIRRLGIGGMAEVFLVRDAGGREMALKRLLGDDVERMDLFL